MACDVQTLISSSTCFQCGIIPGTVEWQMIKLAILCRIKNGVSMACDIQTLLDEGKCFACGLAPGQLAFIELALLCQIATGSGGGGSGAVMQGAADPVAPPTNPTMPAIYTNLTSGVIWTWNVVTQAWI